MKEKIRVDMALIKQGLAKSRQSAQAHIMAGLVYKDEIKIIKPSEMVSSETLLTVKQPLHPYVSRGGLKLEKALEVFNEKVEGAVAMDIGAATGGFTDVLLKSGADHVYAIDVGYGQLDWNLRNHPKVTTMERTNARYLKKENFLLHPLLTVMDVSFISITLLIPVLCEIMGEEGKFITLIKPQFEAGKELMEKKGVIKSTTTHQKVIEKVLEHVNAIGWTVTNITYSPIKGPEGNIEFLAKIEKSGTNISLAKIEETVFSAQKALN